MVWRQEVYPMNQNILVGNSGACEAPYLSRVAG